MLPDNNSRPDIFKEFAEKLDGMPLDGMNRFEFYDACCKNEVRLAISTGEQRVYANILLTIGVV